MNKFLPTEKLQNAYHIWAQSDAPFTQHTRACSCKHTYITVKVAEMNWGDLKTYKYAKISKSNNTFFK